jgi:hypothetical protein
MGHNHFPKIYFFTKVAAKLPLINYVMKDEEGFTEHYKQRSSPVIKIVEPPPEEPDSPPNLPDIPACRVSGPYFSSLSLAFASNDEPRETAIASFNISDYYGSLLPISSFALDDFAFIVKPDFDITSAYTLQDNTRTINLPPETLIVVDGNNPNYAAGAVDDTLTTNYVFNGLTHSIPGGQSIPLSSAIQGVINLGVPAQPHNNISLAQLYSLGFVTDNTVAFKIMHVAHGSGNVTLNISVPQCENVTEITDNSSFYFDLGYIADGDYPRTITAPLEVLNYINQGYRAKCYLLNANYDNGFLSLQTGYQLLGVTFGNTVTFDPPPYFGDGPNIDVLIYQRANGPCYFYGTVKWIIL